MHRWSRPAKRALLAAMLLPWPLLGGFMLAIVRDLESDGAGGPGLAIALWLSAFGLALLSGLACVVDAVRGRVSKAHRGGWVVALLLASTMAGPVYWWLHVRPAPGEVHGLDALTPAHEWSPLAKALSAVASVLMVVGMIGWMAWIVSLSLDLDAEPAIGPIVTAFMVLTLVACFVIAAFFLDALREGGTHAALWSVLLAFAWPMAAPLYWLLFVRPRARPDGGP